MQQFSVLLSVYSKENASYLDSSLKSVFEQSALPDEVILVEDGPLTPELEKIISFYKDKYSTLKVVPIAENCGLGNALNEGLKHCSFELVARMDTDDICYKNRFMQQLEVFEKFPDLDVVGGSTRDFSNDITDAAQGRVLPEKHEDIVEFCKRRNPINHPTVMFKKSTVMRAGGYIHFYLMEDYYLWCRMILLGARFYNIPEPILYFRSNENMFARRGGVKYALSEVKLFKFLYDNKFITFATYILNITVRFTIRIMPNCIRKFLYINLLR